MPLLGRKTDEEKAAHEAAKAQAEATKSAEQAKRQAEAEALRRRTEEHRAWIAKVGVPGQEGR
jgi:hypothetical protein